MKIKLWFKMSANVKAGLLGVLAGVLLTAPALLPFVAEGALGEVLGQVWLLVHSPLRVVSPIFDWLYALFPYEETGTIAIDRYPTWHLVFRVHKWVLVGLYWFFLGIVARLAIVAIRRVTHA